MIHVVLDNLNTHHPSAFYEAFSADEAQKLMQRVRFHYTPKSGSWLNMIEIEFSALARLCLNRRIPTMDELASQVLAFVNDRDAKRIKINRQFSIESARSKLISSYEQVNILNRKYFTT